MNSFEDFFTTQKLEGKGRKNKRIDVDNLLKFNFHRIILLSPQGLIQLKAMLFLTQYHVVCLLFFDDGQTPGSVMDLHRHLLKTYVF